jgi:hypothetical protein
MSVSLEPVPYDKGKMNTPMNPYSPKSNLTSMHIHEGSSDSTMSRPPMNLEKFLKSLGAWHLREK